MCEQGLILSALLSTGAAYIIVTPADSPYVNLASYGITAVNRTSLNFSVRGCDNAHVAIYQGTTLYESMFEFVIGARSNSGYDIREYTAGAVAYRVSTTGVLMDCDRFKEFWVSWNLTAAGYRSWLLGVGNLIFSDVIANFTNTNRDNDAWVSIGIAPYQSHSLEWDFDIEIQSTTENAGSVFPDTTSGGSTVGANTENCVGSTSEPPTGNTTETCFCRTLTQLSEEDLAAFIKNITRILKVDKKETSSYRRSLISVKEDRPSARAIGNLGAIFIVAVIGGICALDLPRFIRFSFIKLNDLRNSFHDTLAVHHRSEPPQIHEDAE